MNLNEWLFAWLPPRQFALLQWIGASAEQAGMAAYLVGGSIRDLLLTHHRPEVAPSSNEMVDLDVTVEGNAIALARRLADTNRAEVRFHHRFGTASLFFDDGLVVDLVTARREEYEQPAVLPRVIFGTLEEDLRRRDFSINTLAMTLAPKGFGELVDPLGGLADLKQGLVRFLHAGSFVDDPTRLFRAVRFEQRFSFQLEERTHQALQEAVQAGLLQRLSDDRTWNEIVHLLSEEFPERALERLADLRVLSSLEPQWAFPPSLALRFKRLRPWLSKPALQALSDDWIRWWIYWLVWMVNLPDELTARLAIRFPLPAELLQVVGKLPELIELAGTLGQASPSPSALTKKMANWPLPALLSIPGFHSSEEAESRIMDYLCHWRHIRTAMGGDDLKQMGIPPGPVYQQILDRVLVARLDGLVDAKEDELTLARRLWREALDKAE